MEGVAAYSTGLRYCFRSHRKAKGKSEKKREDENRRSGSRMKKKDEHSAVSCSRSEFTDRYPVSHKPGKHASPPTGTGTCFAAFGFPTVLGF